MGKKMNIVDTIKDSIFTPIHPAGIPFIAIFSILTVIIGWLWSPLYFVGIILRVDPRLELLCLLHTSTLLVLGCSEATRSLWLYSELNFLMCWLRLKKLCPNKVLCGLSLNLPALLLVGSVDDITELLKEPVL